MLTNIVRTFCALIDVGAVVAISVAATRHVARWRRRRRAGLPTLLLAHRDVRVLRGTDRPGR